MTEREQAEAVVNGLLCGCVDDPAAHARLVDTVHGTMECLECGQRFDHRDIDGTHWSSWEPACDRS